MTCNFPMQVTGLHLNHLQNALAKLLWSAVPWPPATMVRAPGIFFHPGLSFNSHIKQIFRTTFPHLQEIAKIKAHSVSKSNRKKCFMSVSLLCVWLLSPPQCVSTYGTIQVHKSVSITFPASVLVTTGCIKWYLQPKQVAQVGWHIHTCACNSLYCAYQLKSK